MNFLSNPSLGRLTAKSSKTCPGSPLLDSCCDLTPAVAIILHVYHPLGWLFDAALIAPHSSLLTLCSSDSHRNEVPYIIIAIPLGIRKLIICKSKFYILVHTFLVQFPLSRVNFSM